MKRRRVILFGLDGAQPTFMEKFAAEGIMPNFIRLMESGAYTRLVPQIPVATPINWASIATGAPPGVHGVTGFWYHSPGAALDEFRADRAFSSEHKQAETLWQALESEGRRAVLVKFPGSWPFSVKNGIQVDGYCIPAHGQNPLELAINACYSTRKLHKAQAVKLLRNASDSNLTGEVKVRTNRGEGISLSLRLIAYSHADGARLRLLRRDGTTLADLGVGEWSAFSVESFGGGLEGTVRFKLMALNIEQQDLVLYQSQIYPTSGYTFPDQIARDLLENAGPFIEHISLVPWKNGWIDFQTAFEEAQYQAEWIAKAAEHLLSTHEWDLFAFQFHWCDFISHYFTAPLDPFSPLFAEAEAPHCWDVMRQGYQLADELLGRIMALADERTVVAVVSDHGNMPDKRTVALLSLFRQAGLIQTREDANGQRVIDWSRTKAYPSKPGNVDVWVNLAGRDPNGWIEPGAQYEAVRDEVINFLTGLKDTDGTPVYAFVARKEHAENWGLFGDRVGDVVAVYTPGYSWSGHGGEEWLRTDGAGFATPDPKGEDYTAHHGPTLPTASTGISTNLCLMALSGPGVRRGYRRPPQNGAHRVIDVAPTLALLLGCRPPAQSQGAVLRDLLEV